MNEHIAELAKHAGFDVSMYDPDKDIDGLNMTFIPVFAESIINEILEKKNQHWCDNDIKTYFGAK